MQSVLCTVLSWLKNNFTTCIAVISLLISLYNWWFNFRHTKAKLNLIFKHCKIIRNQPGTPMSFHLIIENLSHLDVSISRMFLCVGDKRYEFDSLPYQIMKYTSPEETKLQYSSALPITIPGLGAYGGFFCVRLDDYKNFDISSFLSDKVSIFISTNRKFQKSFDIELKSDEAETLSYTPVEHCNQ